MKLRHSVALLAAATLSACEQPPSADTAVKAQPAATGAVTASGGRLVLPAVKGNPGAAYVTLENATGIPVAVAGVAIEGAGKAEIHQTAGGSMAPVDRIDVGPGQSAEFTPGGLHIMVFDLDSKLQAGGKAELTVTFADGKVLKAPLTAEPPGGAMDHMDHGDGH